MPVKNYICWISGAQAHLRLVVSFPGVPGTFCVDDPEHVAELLHDPERFAADLAGTTLSQYRKSCGELPCPN